MSAKFLDRLTEAIQAGTFVKLSLGGYKGLETGLEKFTVRAVDIRGELALSLVTQYSTRDITKNYPVAEGVPTIANAMRTDFNAAHLFTTAGDTQWQRDGRGREKMHSLPASQNTVPERAHDRRKNRVLSTSSAGWMRHLGIMAKDGSVKVGMADKLRQIEHFAEILSHTIQIDEPVGFRVVDMGSGKGYLTFAIYDFLRTRVVSGLEIKGVEFRRELVDLCNRAADESGFGGLHFFPGSIDDFPEGPLDLLLALHACDTATDDALFHGIRSKARWMLVAPCCHKEIRPQIQPPPDFRELLRHGIFLERQAEMLTDTLRSLLLEANGYRTKIFEFVSTEHTGRNTMISARLDGTINREVALKKYGELKAAFGIRHQHLEERLAG